MTTPLIDILWPDRPEGYDHYGLKATRPDLRTRNGFRWPTNGRVELPAPGGGFTPDVCPQFDGDGLSVALTVKGMTQGGYSPTTVLLVAWNTTDELARDDNKAKVVGCHVHDLVDGLRTIRERGSETNLAGAYLARANLARANLARANLDGANHNKTTVWPTGFQP